jgi:serine/threonine-protein kinase HipA
MPSEPTRVFVWVWLPGTTDPIVAGALDQVGNILTFTYGQSYLQRTDAIPIYLPDLPLQSGAIEPRAGSVPGPIADAAPDAWGMRVILARLVGRGADDVDELSPLTCLIESGSDRTGALDFQTSATDYVPRGTGEATLDELMTAADRVEQGLPLSGELDQALLHGSSIGGARPKAVLYDGGRGLIAKFSSTTDTYPIVKGEFVSMELAARAGLNVAHVEVVRSLGRDALLIERFDRCVEGTRRAMVSALTILGLDANTGRYASYVDLAAIIRARFTDPDTTLRELFSRVTFNILTGNNDDHARNHAAFWDGAALTLTPAYDLSPQPRAGGETKQLMAIGENGWRYSQVAGCLDWAHIYHLTKEEAREIIDHQIDVIMTQWNDVCDQGNLTQGERDYFWKRQYLNDYSLEGW